MKPTFMCRLIGHKWPKSEPAREPVEQQCQRCTEKRHHNGCDAYDLIDWKPGPLPQS